MSSIYYVGLIVLGESMRKKRMRRSWTSSLTALIIIAAGIILGPDSRVGKAAVANQSQEGSFNLNRLPEDSRRYSLILYEGEERNVSGTFTVEQLQILQAIMTEAEKFAMSAEGVSAKEPVTTRFTDKYERAFIVDVEKSGNQSALFVTLKTDMGRLTLQAGRIIRTTRREEGFFFDLLSRLESTLPKQPARSR
jgi:hypothetical protein